MSARKVRVQIDRGEGRYETFHGLVLAETDTHIKVQWLTASEWTSWEWFAKHGRRVQCVLLDEDLNPVRPLTDPDDL